MIYTYNGIYANCKRGVVPAHIERQKETLMPSSVTAVPAAPSALAREHFAQEFTFETDCSDVHLAVDTDGDGRMELTLWRPATGTFIIKSSLDNSVSSKQFGQRLKMIVDDSDERHGRH